MKILDSSPAISVIVPTYNRGWCLEKTLRSVLNQTFSDLELIVVDDGSTDATREIISAFPDIHYLRLGDNQGVSRARNQGVAMARGRYLCFLDSDDRWLPAKLETQWRHMEAHPGTPACYTDEIWIRRGVRVNPRKKHGKHSGDVFRQCLPLCIISPSSIMVRSKIFRELGGFDEALPACEDYELWLRLAARYPVDFIAEPLIIKTGGHADQLSRKYWGMDRFRVYAMEKLLKNGILDRDQRRWVYAALAEKCAILCAGYRNRGKPGPADRYQYAADHYAALAKGRHEVSEVKDEVLGLGPAMWQGIHDI